MLTSGAISEHDDQMFCNSCYRKNFGPKGYGFGGGAGTLSMDDGKGYQTNPNEIDHKAKAYVAPKKPLVQSTAENTAPAPTSKAADVAAKFKPKWGGADICPRCDKSVFIAELMRGAGKAWHKSCFTCQLCNKRVDSSMLCEREGDIYCKSCYGRNFGPKGVGYGIGAGTLQTN
jgi:cysteine/glycine-rich protein